MPSVNNITLTGIVGVPYRRCTTTSDRTHLWETKHPLKRAERLSNLRAPRTTRLLKLTTKNMKSKPANSRYE
jgi:hypothetical protein